MKMPKIVSRFPVLLRLTLGMVAMMGIIGLLSFQLSGCSSDETPVSHRQPSGTVPVKGMVTMVDLGADSCIPCKMMAPIIEKLEKTYRGKAAIVFIDVWKDKDQAKRFGIRAIPTQIFFDKEGNEVYRHTGFMGEADIVGRLKKMGVG
jgi:thioredoxin 1